MTVGYVDDVGRVIHISQSQRKAITSREERASTIQCAICFACGVTDTGASAMRRLYKQPVKAILHVVILPTSFTMNSTAEDRYRTAPSRRSLGDVYLLQECVFGPGYFSSCPRTKEERDQQLLIYCTRFLPSPIFNMERLMPTNREAQKKYLPFPLDEEKPEPTSMMPEEPKEEEMKEAMKYWEVEEMEVDEAEDTKRKEEDNAEDTKGKKEDNAEDTKGKKEDKAEDTKGKKEDKAEDTKEKKEDKAEDTKGKKQDKAEDTKRKKEDEAEDTKGKKEDKAEDTKEKKQDKAEGTKGKKEDKAEDTKGKKEDKAEDTKAKEEHKAEDTKGKEDEKKSEAKEEKKSNWARRVENQPAGRHKIRHRSILKYINTNLRGRRNIIWTILLKSMRR
ncbi:uncharacterized protein [Phyllobates terribilis]|uniref:uncharacterized protein n=1 Tax=Phyllobates terribilis TaxID=111132 RepID=UPI003CCA896F